MTIKGLNEYDIVNYKKPSMFIIFPICSWKCEYECGQRVCQNSTLATTKNIEIHTEELVARYLGNPLTSAVVLGGLEPLDSWDEIKLLIRWLRFKDQEVGDIVIYTGYKEDEIQDKIEWLKQYKNIIIKFGRFIPDQEKHYDEVLGVYLASDNQYGKRIS